MRFNNQIRFAVRTDAPYKLGEHLIILPDGAVAYTDHNSLDSYAAEHGGEYRTVTSDEMWSIISEAEQDLCTTPAEISEDEFYESLEVLPPCRWHTHKGIELFHVSERLTGNLVTWCAKIGERHFSFTQDARTDSDTLAALVSGAVAS